MLQTSPPRYEATPLKGSFSLIFLCWTGLVGGWSQLISPQLPPKDLLLWVFWRELPILKAWATFSDFTHSLGWDCLIWLSLVLFCFAWTTVQIYLQLSLLSENVALRQCQKPFPIWTLMVFLWFLNPLPSAPPPTHTSAGSSVPQDLGWSSSFQSACPDLLSWPFLPAAIMVKCLTGPCSDLSMCQNQHTICTSGFFRADPKRSIYPDIDILMSNGQKLWGHTVGGRIDFRIPPRILYLNRDVEIVNSNHFILG